MKTLKVMIWLSLTTSLLCSCCSTREERIARKRESLLRQRPDYEQLRKLPMYEELLRLPDYKTAAKKFKEKLEKATDPKLLTDWALVQLRSHQKEEITLDLDDQNLPDFIRKMDAEAGSPTVSVVLKAEQSLPFVLIRWGGGFGIWGIAVGSSKFVPKNDQLYFVKWKSGIFVFHSKT